MSDYLIALSIGPVQDFIAAARKTRDLWFGSFVLSEVSKAAAKSFNEQKGAILIFPATPENEGDLEPNSELNVANKLLVQVSAANEVAVKERLKSAKDKAKDRWNKLAEDAKKLPHDAVRKDIWDKQINDVLELFGAWVRIENGNYAGARDRVNALLAARKMARDFVSAAKTFDESPYFGLPKSSLDAARETVLKENLPLHIQHTLDLGGNEQLDCPGLVKRMCGGDPQRFAPVTRIALESWFSEKLLADADFQTIKNDIYPKLHKCHIATQVATSHYATFGFDGALLFPERIEATKAELKQERNNFKKKAQDPRISTNQLSDDYQELESTFETKNKLLDALKELRDKLYANPKYGRPESYYAVLVADGDKMGKYLDSCKTHGEQQEVSRILDKFARHAPEIVTQHQGACVYSGGDDVMALLPIHTAVQCADALQEDFAAKVSHLPEDKEKRPTLSVGLGLAHIMTPFSVALDVGRRAETLAKAKDKQPEEQGNALAIIADVRSGAELSVRGQWGCGIVSALEKWRQAYLDGVLPATAPYELQNAVNRMAWAKPKNSSGTATEQEVAKQRYLAVTQQEISRLLKKKRESGGDKAISPELIQTIEGAIPRHGFENLLQQLRIARWLAGKHKE